MNSEDYATIRKGVAQVLTASNRHDLVDDLTQRIALEMWQAGHPADLPLIRTIARRRLKDTYDAERVDPLHLTKKERS